MPTETAKSILNNTKYVSAFAKWSRKPMETSEEDFNLAMDWSEALLSISTNAN